MTNVFPKVLLLVLFPCEKLISPDAAVFAGRQTSGTLHLFRGKPCSLLLGSRNANGTGVEFSSAFGMRKSCAKVADGAVQE